MGDGAGVNVDISVNFYRYLTGDQSLEKGTFGVANFFYPKDKARHSAAEKIILDALHEHNLAVLMWRDVVVNKLVLNPASQKAQLSIRQVVFARPAGIPTQEAFEEQINFALADIELPAFTRPELAGFYPLSMSSYTQVYKGRLNSWEVIPFFKDLTHPEHKVHTLFFHTRFSTNTAPNPIFAQPFRRMAHNGELNTDKKNRLSEDAIARFHRTTVIYPDGQSDSARLDQTLARRITEDKMDIVLAVLAMMPPAWENDQGLSQSVRDMLEYFSLSEEKNDGPAALIFGDGVKVGARLDRLGLRPLRSVETNDYFAVMSEAGQIDFEPDSIIRRGRIEAGGMIVFDHSKGQILEGKEILEDFARREDYKILLKKASVRMDELPKAPICVFGVSSELKIPARHVAYSLNQESFKFMLDPMLQSGSEKISAMGYGVAPNSLSAQEGGMSCYFSQRFAQVTNPPLDSIREADGMTLRVALGAKPYFSPLVGVDGSRQLILNSPILKPIEFEQIRSQDILKVETVETLFDVNIADLSQNEEKLKEAVERVCDSVESLARSRCDIIILSDAGVSYESAAIPAILLISAVNQRLIRHGLRFDTSIVYLTGQAVSTHDIACLLGFGASAVCPLSVYHRALELSSDDASIDVQLKNFQKAVEKALMKTMGKFGLCTVESYIGGEFFEANFIDTQDPYLKKIFPNINSPVGGAGFHDIAKSIVDWHAKIKEVQSEDEIPMLGLFKERVEGAGHAFGSTAVRGYVDMTEEPVQYIDQQEVEEDVSMILPTDDRYRELGFEKLTSEQIDKAKITEAYRSFCEQIYAEREHRPSTLRDILALPLKFTGVESEVEFVSLFKLYSIDGNNNFSAQGLRAEKVADHDWQLTLDDPRPNSYDGLLKGLRSHFGSDFKLIESPKNVPGKHVRAFNDAAKFLTNLVYTPKPLPIESVESASQITSRFASGAMSHGALVARAHEAVAQGTNIAGAMSNSGEGGENSKRFNSVKASKIKQFASGRFGVWTGYLSDPSLEEIEIKIAQGAKPGEGGQLPAKKVNVEIAAARGGTPGVELVSPPPHHDTYSIEDLAQLIHDAKCARVRVIVKLVSSEGIGTIAVGVAKAGADVINIAGNTGGTGAAQVTSLKHTGRVADIGIAEVHQALAENGLRDKVSLRCSNAHQTGMDVIKSAILGGDSFEFGTTALMMLKCVMAKNCNVKCPAGLTTNAEMYQGDPRALAQYFINLAHEVREILASIGYSSLRDVRGQTQLLNLVAHPAIVGKLDLTGMLREVQEKKIEKPIYLEADFAPDTAYLKQFKNLFIKKKLPKICIKGPVLFNNNKTVGGQFAVDVERILNWNLSATEIAEHPAVITLKNGRAVLAKDAVKIKTSNSAGQSFGAFNNTGITLEHIGTCNDGVGKGCSGGEIVIRSPNTETLAENVLIGNFALFGATGGHLFVEGQAGDRFAVRNSGAVAVVQGVGDFCCEYMTNGSVVNLGHYGKGFGNGMSGGTAYQYDPEHRFSERCSQDSVKAFPLFDESRLACGQEQALLVHLEQHLERTGSRLTKALLDDWKESRKHFYYIIPLSLMSYHRAEPILAAMSRKTMIEELASAIASRQARLIHDGYSQQQTSGVGLFDGKVPAYGDCDGPLIMDFAITSGVLHRAYELAKKTGEADLDKTSVKLIVTEDKKLMDLLTKDVTTALKDYSDEALSCLLADKRLTDYKDSLRLREVWDSDALGTTSWIMECDSVNSELLERYPAMNEQLARHFANLLVGAMQESVI